MFLINVLFQYILKIYWNIKVLQHYNALANVKLLPPLRYFEIKITMLQGNIFSIFFLLSPHIYNILQYIMISRWYPRAMTIAAAADSCVHCRYTVGYEHGPEKYVCHLRCRSTACIASVQSLFGCHLNFKAHNTYPDIVHIPTEDRSAKHIAVGGSWHNTYPDRGFQQYTHADSGVANTIHIPIQRSPKQYKSQ